MKIKTKRILSFISLSSFLPIAISTMAVKCKQPKPTNPTPTPEAKNEDKLINKWLLDETNNNLSIVNGKEKEFYEAINKGSDFWYDYKTGKIIATEKGKNPDWKNNKNYLLEFKGINLKRNYQVVNEKNPTWDNGQKLSSKIDYEINENNEIIFKYKGAIFDNSSTKKHIISTETAMTNLGKKISSDTIDKIVEMTKKTSEVMFDYPDKENTYLKDADVKNITRKIPDGYELETYKAIKNLEKDYYDITIIYKLKIKDTNITMLKNASYTIKGFKKTQEIIDFENEAKEKLNTEISKVKVSILDEKAYQHIIKEKSITNFDNKLNFVTDGYNTELYNVSLSNVKLETHDGKTIVKVTAKLYAKNNKDIYLEKEITVENEYAKGKNFHNLTQTEIEQYLTEKLTQTTLYPKYSKDKTYIEKLQNGKISNKSFWINNIDHNLNYEFGYLSKDTNNDYYVDVTASIKGWIGSPSITKKVKIDLSTLGVNILNEIRRKKGQQEEADQFAPSSTIEDQTKPDLSLDKFKDTSKDKTISTHAPQLNKFLNKIDYLYTWDNELFNLLKENPSKKLLQFYTKNKEYNLYFYDLNKSMEEQQTIYVFSKFVYKDGKLFAKITAMTVQDYNANEFNESKMASKIIEIKNDKLGKDLYQKYIDSLKFNKEIELLNLTYDYKDKGNITSGEANKLEQEKIISNLIIKNLPEGYNVYKIGRLKKQKEGKLTLFLYFKKNDFESIVSIKITITGFKI